MPVPSALAGGLSEPSPGGSDEVVRIAVTNAMLPKNSNVSVNHLMQFSRSCPLTEVLKELCSYWKYQEQPVEDYGLRFENTKCYVTESNKHEIKNGSVLRFCLSAKKLATDWKAKLAEPQSRLDALKSMEKDASDFAVAEELICQRLLHSIIHIISEESDGCPASAQTVSHVILIFHEIMKHDDLISWEDEIISNAFISKVAANIDTEKTMLAMKQDEHTQVCCLNVLESLILTPAKYEATEQVISLASLLNFLQSDTMQVQQSALSLFNTLFRLGDRSKKRKMKQVMEERQTRRRIVDCVIKRGNISREMDHQLYVLQTLLLNLLEERLYTQVETQGQKALEKIKELRKIAFEGRGDLMPLSVAVGGGSGGGGPAGSSGGGGASATQKSKFADEHRRLGFQNEINPTQDFKDHTPPGMLALDMMFTFACSHSEDYSRLILEARETLHDCPFARASIEVVKIMCDLVGIGRDPLATVPSMPDGRFCFFPFFFAHENPLEEMFAIVIQHVHKTWKEMRATTEDFRKVMDVAHEQMHTALMTSPSTMDEFRKSLKTYNEISERRKEAAKNRSDRDGLAIQHLRATLTPEITDLIQRQRLNVLVSGGRFQKLGSSVKGKTVFLKLSANHKAFHYGEWHDDRNAPAVENLDSKLPIAEIRDFISGSSATMVLGRDTHRRNKERSSDGLALSLHRENGDTLDLIAPNQKTFDHWCDGIHALLRREMKSNEAAKDLEVLLSMEEKIRLLPLEGIEIPKEAPPIPPLPDNFNFCQNMS